MVIRSFLAFELPGPMKAVLARTLEALKGSGLDVRWTPVEKIHLTMVFLGDVPEDGIPFVSEAAGRVCSRYAPVTAAITGVGIFGPPRRPRILWAGLTGETALLAGLQRELFEALEPAGVKFDGRPFKPHLTLGRFRGRSPAGEDLQRLMETHDDMHSDVCLLDELVLFKSDLTPRGAVYTALARMPMTGSPQQAARTRMEGK